MHYPIAERHPHKVVFSDNNGFEANKDDYYYWLRDDARNDKKVKKYLDEENDYFDNIILKKGVLPKKNKFMSELKKYFIENYSTIKLPQGINCFESQYRFYSIYEKGNSFPIFCYENNGIKQEYLNPNILTKTNNNITLIDPFFNPELNIFGYGIDHNGSEKYEIILKKFPSLEKIEHNIPDLYWGNIILANNSLIFFNKEDSAKRLYQLWKYSLETNESELIYQENDINRELEINLGDDNQSIIFSSVSFADSCTNIYWFDGPYKEKIWKQQLKNNVDTDIRIFKDFLIDRTNKGNYYNYNLQYCKIGNIRFYNLIDYDDHLCIDNFYILKSGILLLCRENGEQYLRYLHLTIKKNKLLVTTDKKFKNYKGGYYLNIEYSCSQSNKIIYSYQSLLHPKTYYELDWDSMNNILVKKMETLYYNPDNYKVERLFVKNVPIDILMSKKHKMNGTSNCLLYGYGAYGTNTEIKFDEKLFPLIDQGFCYVLANVRGSSYMGFKYYRDGKMSKKINSMKDFICVSEFLIRKKYCSPDRLNIEGRSAGGLLVSSVAIMRPDLYRTVISSVPFVDVLVTMADETIPLTTNEWLQWGNPNNKEFYGHIKKYSPIDNIKKDICYPNFVMFAGYNDNRVGYWEPAKFIATLRYNQSKKCQSIYLLKTSFDSGHFSHHDRYNLLNIVAEKYAILEQF